MIDFDALVLGPAMNAFAEPFTIWPRGVEASAYDVRGVWSDRPNDVVLEGDLISSSQIRTVGLRLSELPNGGLNQNDVIVRKKDGRRYYVDDTDDDGQGGTVATLKDAP